MFNYPCQECGKGAVRAKEFKNYKTKIRGYPFVVDKAVIGVCDKCKTKHFDGPETERWERLFDKKLEREGIYHSPQAIEGLRKNLGLSIEDFAYLIGATRQSIYNWERRDREKPQSRTVDLLMKLVRYSMEKEKVDVLAFLIHESQKLGIDIKVKRGEFFTAYSRHPP